MLKHSGGGWYLLGIQGLSVVCIVFWGVSSTFLLLWLVNRITPIRMSSKDEILGADYTEHNIRPPRAVEAIQNDSQISQRTQEGVYKPYFTDELATDRSTTPARINHAYQHDEGA